MSTGYYRILGLTTNMVDTIIRGTGITTYIYKGEKGEKGRSEGMEQELYRFKDGDEILYKDLLHEDENDGTGFYMKREDITNIKSILKIEPLSILKFKEGNELKALPTTGGRRLVSRRSRRLRKRTHKSKRRSRR